MTVPLVALVLFMGLDSIDSITENNISVTVYLQLYNAKCRSFFAFHVLNYMPPRPNPLPISLKYSALIKMILKDHLKSTHQFALSQFKSFIYIAQKRSNSHFVPINASFRYYD